MVRIAVPASILCALALIPSAHARTPDCRTTGRTVTSNSKVRVYRVSRDEGDYHFACAYEGRGRRFLGVDEAWSSYGESVSNVNLRGRFLSYANTACLDPCEWYAAVVDMRTRKAVRKASGRGGVRELRVTRARSLALLIDLSYENHPWYRVLKVDRDGRTMLDEGARIAPHSLAVSRHRAYWTHGHEPRSARIE